MLAYARSKTRLFAHSLVWSAFLVPIQARVRTIPVNAPHQYGVPASHIGKVFQETLKYAGGRAP